MHYGKKLCCHSKRDGSDLWRQSWERLDQMPQLISVQKVKAHLTYQDVLDGRIPWALWIGRGVADLWAKAACAEATRIAPCQRVHSAWTRATAYFRWAAAFSSQWIDDTGTSIPPPEETPAAAAPRARRTRAAAVKHELWESSARVWCRSCGISAPKVSDGPPPPLRRSCRGNMGVRCKVIGRERGVSPAAHAFDEGAISIATLRLFGAELVYSTEENTQDVEPSAIRGHAVERQAGTVAPAHAYLPNTETCHVPMTWLRCTTLPTKELPRKTTHSGTAHWGSTTTVPDQQSNRTCGGGRRHQARLSQNQRQQRPQCQAGHTHRTSCVGCPALFGASLVGDKRRGGWAPACWELAAE